MKQRKKINVSQDKDSRNERFYEMIKAMWKDVQKGKLDPDYPSIGDYAKIYQSCNPKKDFIVDLLKADHEPTRLECDIIRQRISDHQKKDGVNNGGKVILTEKVAVEYLRSISTDSRWYEIQLVTRTKL